MKIKIRRKTKKYISALLIAVFLVCCVSFFTLRKVEAGSDIIAIDTYGGYLGHVLALKSDGTVWAWGNNQFGQIGVGTAGGFGDFRVPPVKVQNLTNVVAIAAGEYSSYALKSDGTVWAWGCNDYGQLGDGTTTDRYTPVRVKNLTGVRDIVAGRNYAFAIKNDGTAWAWGGSGCLGDGTSEDRHTPVRVKNLTNVKQISTDGGILSDHAVAVKTDGTVWAWGKNSDGQIGDGTSGIFESKYEPVRVKNLSGVIAVGTSDASSYAVKSNGTVWAWGDNSRGQLGDGTTTDRLTPVQVKNLTGVKAVEGNWYQCAALKSDGTVWAWGCNDDGQLGDGTTTERHTPVRVKNISGVKDIRMGSFYGYAIRNDNIAWAWGYIWSEDDNGLPHVLVNRFEPSHAKLSMRIGETKQITVNGKLILTGINTDLSNRVVYSSADPSIAEVNNNGLVTAKKTGNTEIQVTYNCQTCADKTITIPVTVEAALTSITVSPSSVTLDEGKTLQLTVTANYYDGSTETVTNSATYSSSNTTIATVSSSGLITAKKHGSAVITVSYAGFSKNILVTINPVVTSISVSPSVVTIWKGETSQLTVTAHFSDGTTEDVTSKATYQLNTDAVTVNSTGEVTGNKVGSARILVTYDGESAYVDVNVLEPVVEKITVISEGGSNVIRKGGTLQLRTIAVMSDGTIKNVTNEANYESSDPSIATVSDTGLVKGLDVGSVTITAEYDDKTATVKIEVDPKLYVYIRRLE